MYELFENNSNTKLDLIEKNERNCIEITCSEQA